MVETPFVSIILPTYNRAATIRRSIDSVLRQTYSNFELLVIDDGSTDGTGDIVRSINDDRIRYIEIDKNMGAAAARNAGVENSVGGLLAFQDSDDEWLPDKLKKQVLCMESASSEVGMVYSDMTRIFKDGQTMLFGTQDVVKGKIFNVNTLEYQVFGIGQQTTLIKKECFTNVGLFDCSFPRFIDLEFFVRLSLQYEAVRIHEPLVTFYETEGISSNWRASVQSRLMLLKKYHTHLKNCKSFIANQYAMIGGTYLTNGRLTDCISSYCKALVKQPFCKTVWYTILRDIKRNLIKNCFKGSK